MGYITVPPGDIDKHAAVQNATSETPISLPYVCQRCRATLSVRAFRFTMPARRTSQRRLFGDSQSKAVAVEMQMHVNDLPEPILLEIFRQLSKLPPSCTAEDAGDEAVYTRRLPFRTFEYADEIHPGLRAYPFLAQVCRHWKRVLESPAALQLWDELVIDLGHELVTGVHVPIAWSDVRPTDEEFEAAFSRVTLTSYKLVQFVRRRRHVLRRLVLANTEGFFNDEHFVYLSNKHDFSLGTLGVLLGMLGDQLQELHFVLCSDLLSSPFSINTISLARSLRSLVIEDLQHRVSSEQLEDLGHLTALTKLSLCAAPHPRHNLVVGISAIPNSWQRLSQLRALELRGNVVLECLPRWMPGAMPHLQLLDLSMCTGLDLTDVVEFTQLTTLALQGLDLVWDAIPESVLEQAARQGRAVRASQLPDLSALTALRALSLADNNLVALPPWLLRMARMEVLDLSGNLFLELRQPLTPLLAWRDLRYLDLRAVHVQMGGKFWSPAKCESMQNILALAKGLRRKNRHARVLYDSS